MDSLNDPICSRRLSAVFNGNMVDVLVAIGRPSLVNDESGDYECEFLVQHRYESINDKYRATDSMQALSGCFMAIQHTLFKNLEDVRWLGTLYAEFGLYVIVEDAARRREILSIVDNDEYALSERFRRQEERSRQRHESTHTERDFKLE